MLKEPEQPSPSVPLFHPSHHLCLFLSFPQDYWFVTQTPTLCPSHCLVLFHSEPRWCPMDQPPVAWIHRVARDPPPQEVEQQQPLPPCHPAPPRERSCHQQLAQLLRCHGLSQPWLKRKGEVKCARSPYRPSGLRYQYAMCWGATPSKKSKLKRVSQQRRKHK